MAKKLRHALEIIWHNPTTRIVHGTAHRVIDFFKRIYLSTTLKPYNFILPRAFQPSRPISKSDISCFSNDDF